MANKVIIGPLPTPAIYTPFGKVGYFSAFVYNTTTSGWEELKYISMRSKKALNQMSSFEIETYEVTDAKKVYIKEKSEILIFADDTLWLKGRIQDVEYSTNYGAIIKGFGMESVLAEKQFIKDGNKRVTYTNTSAQTIANEILSEGSDGSSPWIMDPDTDGLFNTDYGDVTIRFEYSSRIKSLAGLCETIDYDWWIDHSGNTYENDYFNIAPSKGSATSVKTYKVSGSGTNCSVTTNEKDVNDFANRVDVLCYSDDTEVLTKDGWKLFKEVTKLDEIATLNPNNNKLEYYNPVALQKYRYSGEMYKIYNQQVDLLVTPEHKIYGTKTAKGNKELYEVNKLDKYSVVRLQKWFNWDGEHRDDFFLPGYKDEHVCGKLGKGLRITEKEPMKLNMNLWLKFLGWYLSEGSLSKNVSSGYKINIRQINKENLVEIYNIVKYLGFKPYMIKDGSVQFYSKQLWLYLKRFGLSKDKYVPRFIKDLCTDQIKVFLNTLFKGDGCFSGNNFSQYYTNSKRLSDDVQELLLKAGYSTNKKYRPDRRIYTVLSNKTTLNPHIKVNKSNDRNSVFKEVYNGYVYDLTVPEHHIIYVRRKGKGVWCGNCYGDGENQLKTDFYDASDTFSSISTEISDTDTSLTVADGSSFPSSGILKIGREYPSYTSKTTDTFTLVRPNNAKRHRKSVLVYESYDGSTSTNTTLNMNNGLVSDATTITLTDSSSFDSPSGTIIMGQEIITYTGNDGSTQLTGCTRGENNTLAQKHSDGEIVFQYDSTKHYTDGSVSGTDAKVDSSIYDETLADIEFIDRSIRDESTAELIASKELLSRKEPVQRIKIEPIEAHTDAQELEIGDYITITDEESDLSGDYRIVSMNLIDDMGTEELVVEVSNKGLAFLEQMSSVKEKAEKESKYMLGATNMMSIGPFAENTDATHPLELKFYMPEDVVAINKLTLNFDVEDYRAYTAASEISNDPTQSEKLTVDTDDLYAAASSISVTSSYPGGAHATFTVPSGDHGQEIEFKIYANIYDTSLHTSGVYRFKVDNGTYDYPDSDGQWLGAIFNSGDDYDTSSDGSHQHRPSDIANEFVTISSGNITATANTETVDGHRHRNAVYSSYDYFLVSDSGAEELALTEDTGDHTHSYDSEDINKIIYKENYLMTGTIRVPEDPAGKTYSIYFKHNDPITTTMNFHITITIYGRHTHDMTYSINEDGGGSGETVTIEVDGVEVDSSLGDTTNLDITDYVSDSSGWKNIKFTPTGKCRIHASGFLKFFVESN